MTTTDDADKFEQRWKNHINDLERLKSSLPPEEWDPIDEAIDNLDDVVEEAADRFRDDDDAT